MAEIVERTDGMPLFVEELTKALLEAGGGRTIPTTAEQAIPATLHASLMARLDRLDSSARAVAQAGAVIGREVPHKLLALVADIGRDELAAALDQLAAAELVLRRDEGESTRYLFKHALVRDAAYGTLLRERRRHLHAAVAIALEQHFPELARRSPELVAHHLNEAGEAERAVGYWLQAGQRAAERSADREAVSHLRRGLALIAGLRASEDRDRTELEFQLAIGTPLIALSGWSGPQVAVAYERASALCERSGELGRLIPALFGLASNRIVRGETKAALEIAERCLAAAKLKNNPVDWILAHRARGAAQMQLGELRKARLEFEAIPALYDAARDRDLAAHCVTDPHASGLSFLALVLWIMGLPDQALRAAHQAAQHSAELQHANTTGHVLCHGGGEVAMLLRDVQSVRSYAAATMTLAAEHDMPMWRGYALVMQGWVAAETGQLEEGLSLVSQGIHELDELGAVFHRTYHLGVLAEIHGRLGNPDAGRRVLERANEEMRRTEVHLFEASLLRLEGDLRLLAREPDADAKKCFVEAVVVARRQGALSFELRAATRLACLCKSQGMNIKARQVLAPVFASFTEGLNTPDLNEAKAVLDTLKECGA